MEQQVDVSLSLKSINKHKKVIKKSTRVLNTEVNIFKKIEYKMKYLHRYVGSIKNLMEILQLKSTLTEGNNSMR